LKSAKFEACDTAAGTCSKPSGFSGTSATLSSQPTNLGDASGWTTTDSVDGALRLSKSGNTAIPTGSQTVAFSNVTNPSTTNSTFFLRITTYSDGAWTTPVDTGTVAASTGTAIDVALTVSETLTFCAGTSITGQNCGTISGNTVDLGEGSVTSTSSGTSVMAASTNGNSGYTITANGSTLTSGSDTINTITLTNGDFSSIGTPQYGINLVSNSTPAIGVVVSGTGTGAAATNYNTADKFKFVTGEEIASASGPTNANAFTVSYIANIGGTTPPGIYTATMVYVATANF
jgi:hypothetical protein